MRRVVDILGMPVDSVTWEEALERASEWLAGRTGPAAHIITANPEMIMRALADPEFGAVFRGADLVVPDGTGVVWASRVLKRPVPHRVAGIDLTSALLERAASMGSGVFLLGAEPGVAEEAASRLREKHPGLRIVGTHHGFFQDDESPNVVRQVQASGASLLLVAMGVPRQELWIARARQQVGVKVAIGVGGALDVFAGRVKRAPVWLQQLGLEWAYRVATDLRRVQRLGALPRFVAQVVYTAWTERGRPK